MNDSIRTVRNEDWPDVKAIRLASLQDPVAHLAFLETYEEAAARPDSYWQDRAAAAAEGRTVRQFVAETSDGRWLGTVSARVELPGAEVAFGEAPEAAQTHLVGVFVRPEARGTGLAEALIEAALDWSWALPEPRIERVRLYVHPDNPRAAALYEKVGFKRTGAAVPFPGDATAMEIELAVPRG